MTLHRIASFLFASLAVSVSACAVGVPDEGPASESVGQEAKAKICPAMLILCIEGYEAKQLPNCRQICVPSNDTTTTSPCDAVKCAAGTHCEEVQVQCITTPCDPIAQCVPDQQCSGSQTYNSVTGQCECNAIGFCIEGYTWDSVACDCVPTAAKCVVSGCSGQICASQDMITTCEWKPEYACYASATCEVQANGSCGWTQTPDLLACLQNSI